MFKTSFNRWWNLSEHLNMKIETNSDRIIEKMRNYIGVFTCFLLLGLWPVHWQSWSVVWQNRCWIHLVKQIFCNVVQSQTLVRREKENQQFISYFVMGFNFKRKVIKSHVDDVAFDTATHSITVEAFLMNSKHKLNWKKWWLRCHKSLNISWLQFVTHDTKNNFVNFMN